MAKLDLQFVIDGATSSFDFSSSEPLHAAIAKVLGQTGHTGRPASEWVATSPNGSVLTQSSSLADLGLTSGAVIFLALSAGQGG